MPNYKQLCAEGVAFIRSATDPDDLSINAEEWADKARAALAEPEPEVPTDIEIASILKAYAVVEPQMGVSRILHEKHFGNAARAVLARWGNSSAPQPAPVSEPPRPKDCDAEGRCWWLIEPYPRPVGPGGKLWSLCRYCPGANYWLPANALPQPS